MIIYMKNEWKCGCVCVDQILFLVVVICKVVLFVYMCSYDYGDDVDIVELLFELVVFGIIMVKLLCLLMKKYCCVLLQEEWIVMCCVEMLYLCIEWWFGGIDVYVNISCYVIGGLVCISMEYEFGFEMMLFFYEVCEDEFVQFGVFLVDVVVLLGYYCVFLYYVVLLQFVYFFVWSMMMVNLFVQVYCGFGIMLFSLLNLIFFGFFVGVLIFDVIYFNSVEVMWGKVVVWLIIFGLLIVVILCLINLFVVWCCNGMVICIDCIDFFFNLVVVVLVIWNVFVYSCDVYVVVVLGMILLVLIVVLIVLGLILLLLQLLVLQGGCYG